MSRTIALNLHPAQSRAFVTPATEVLYGGAAGGGKLLPLSEVLPTPSGWRSMGELRPGDVLFDEHGQPCRVIGLSAIEPTPELYRFTFDDGVQITSCLDHQWLTFDAAELAALTRRRPEWRAARRANRASRATGERSASFTAAITARNKQAPPQSQDAPKGTVRTTRDIVATLRTSTGRKNHAIPVTAPLNLPPAELPVDPYTLGYWLGDGTRGQGAITQAPEDMAEVQRHFEAAGYTVRKRAAHATAWGILGLQKQLRLAGLLFARHIPPAYLRASYDQRLAILQGMMDSDGSADETGGLEFTTTHPVAAETFAELLAGLGIKSHTTEGRAMLNGQDCGPKWRINFTTQLPAFRLPRKAARQAKSKARRTTQFRYICKAERVPTQPGRCIQVDSPSRLFLAGRAMVPTHNSHLLRVAAIAWCQMIPGLQIGLFRRTYPDLNANHMEGPTGFPALLAPLTATGQARIVNGEITWPNGSRIALCHCQYEKDKYKYQGAEFHVLLIDELTHFSEAIYNFLRARVRMTGLEVPAHLRPLFPRILCSANPGGIGHVWVKRTFVNKGTVAQRMPDSEGGMIRQFIPARLSDNPALSASDPTYAARLAGLGDPLLVRAMLDGDWNIVAGAMFGEVWRQARHTVRPFAIPADWPIWWGMDDGYSAPASIHFLTRDPSTKTLFVIGEIYRSQMLPVEIHARICRMSRNILLWYGPDDLRPHGEIAPGILDGAAFADTGQSTERGQKVISRGAQLRALGLKIDAAEKWPGSRVHRARELHRLLAPNPNDPRGLPGIRFFTTCEKAIETIPALPRDPNNIEDVDTKAEDHCFTAGTQIATAEGDKAIEDIREGDLVWTRNGLRPVVFVCPPRQAEVMELHCEGKTLVGTPNHKIPTSQGKLELQRMTRCVTVYTWSRKFLQPQNNDSTEETTTSAETIFSGKASACTLLSGQLATEKSPKDSTFTTRTETEQTTPLPTLPPCRDVNISACTVARQQSANEQREPKTPESTPQQATQNSPLSNAALQPKTDGSTESQCKPYAQNAGNPFPPFGQALRGCAAVPVLNESFAVAGEKKGWMTVYNFTVQGEHEYFANGLLVCNCYDSITYAIQRAQRIFRQQKMA